jgi:hypothetical protein
MLGFNSSLPQLVKGFVVVVVDDGTLMSCILYVEEYHSSEEACVL